MRSRVVVILGIVLLSLNLRSAVSAIAAVIPELREVEGMSGTTAGAVLSLPPLVFALAGPMVPSLAARFGAVRSVVLGLAAATLGQLLRAVIPGSVALFGGTAFALAGVAVANVLMPTLVRTYFPGKMAAMTALYSALMATGGGISTAVTVPAQRLTGTDWRFGLGMWAAMTALALLPWLTLAFAERSGPPATAQRGPARSAGESTAGRPRLALRDLLRSRLAWLMAVYFGCQSLQAYVIFGWLPDLWVGVGIEITTANFYVLVMSVVGVVVTLAVPWLLRTLGLAGVIIAMTVATLLSNAGLMLAPASAPWLWAVLFGIGMSAFPVALTLVAMRARTGHGVTALSAFTQSIGYLIAAIGPILVGVLHDATGTWTVPLLLMSAAMLVHLAAGLRAVRPRYLEDELAGYREKP